MQSKQPMFAPHAMFMHVQLDVCMCSQCLHLVHDYACIQCCNVHAGDAAFLLWEVVAQSMHMSVGVSWSCGCQQLLAPDATSPLEDSAD